MLITTLASVLLPCLFQTCEVAKLSEPEFLVYGEAVALNGTELVVSQPDTGMNAKVYVYGLDQGDWVLDQVIEHPEPFTGSGDPFREFGFSLALKGDSLVIGAIGLGVSAGKFYSYERSPNGWVLNAEFGGAGGSSQTNIGYSLALSEDGMRLAMGQPGVNSFDAGRARYFSKNAFGSWGAGTQLQNPTNSEFGKSVAMDETGNRMVVAGGNEASVYLQDFQYGTFFTYALEVELLPTDSIVNSNFGCSAALGAGQAFIGASTANTGGFKPGAVFVFDLASNWQQSQRLVSAGAVVGDRFGETVDVDGGLLAVAAPRREAPGVSNAGAGYIFESAGGAWTQRAELFASDCQLQDQIGSPPGRGLSLSGSTLAMAAPLEEMEPAQLRSGSAYVFDALTSTTPLELYCTGKANSNGCTARLFINGYTSQSSPYPSLTVSAEGVLPQVNGLMFYGVTGKAKLPFFGGLLCIQPPTKRAGIQFSGADTGPCSGLLTTDVGALVDQGFPGLAVGSEVNAQYWYRDNQQLDGTNVSLSNAIQLVICP